IQQRRRFLKVRTTKGVEGWTDERVLMSPAQIRELRQLSEDTKDFASQGKATTYDVLNIHTEPNRLSPSYVQVKEGEKVDVIAHRVVPRYAPVRKSLLPPPAKISRKPSTKEKSVKVTRVPAPPVPLPPKPPANWLELSNGEEARQAEPGQSKRPTPEPVPSDDWTLVRTAAGQSGWVVTQRLFMAIPDEVAQYAEGRRITSYFSLGKLRDGDLVKDIWLWTTIEKGLMPYDFDGFRVFIWSLRHHRYETALIQRKLKGYYPVLLERVNDRPGFSVCVERQPAELFRRSYALVENLVKFADERPCVLQTIEPLKNAPPPQIVSRTSSADERSGTIAQRLKALRKKWFP
ncbi:MAG: hypothetical protein M3Z36_03470, partial [Acidobacteriota bacterium]|nr:hypothetical protein [Acidobacteriota bacterium]